MATQAASHRQIKKSARDQRNSLLHELKQKQQHFFIYMVGGNLLGLLVMVSLVMIGQRVLIEPIMLTILAGIGWLGSLYISVVAYRRQVNLVRHQLVVLLRDEAFARQFDEDIRTYMRHWYGE